ncbi:MAG: hypothetical protein R3331_05260 [Sulfurospirillaceae bacterium]|nr:hypothetical protein [Sulfurospirillaceae bacterium]
MKAKELYSSLFAAKWTDPITFLQDVAMREEHQFWGAGGAGREFAREILKIDKSWEWLAFRIDDFACLIEAKMRAKIKKWIFRAMLDCGGLAKKLCDTEQAAKWLLDRYVAELKNLFDPRYKNYIDINLVQIEEYFDGRTSCKRLPCKSTIDLQKIEEKKVEIAHECKYTQPSLFNFVA